MGINIDRFIILTFFVSGFLGSLAGMLVGSSGSIAGPYFDIGFGLKGLAVIVLGGLDSILSAVAGGLAIGRIASYQGNFLPIKTRSPLGYFSSS